MAKCDTDSGAVVGIARGVQWWEPGTPSYCKMVNTGRAAGVVRCGHLIAKVIALNVRDDDRFRTLFVHPLPPSLTRLKSPADDPPPIPDSGNNETPTRGVVLSDANIGRLSVSQKNRLMSALQPQTVAGLFPEDTKRVRACTMRELRIPLIDEECEPIAAKQQRFSPEQADAIQREETQLTGAGITRSSPSAWAAQCVTVRKNDGTLRPCQDFRALKNLIKSDSGGLGDVQGIFQRLAGSTWFTSVDLASGFFQLPIAEPDRHKTAFRDAFGQLWDYDR